eukprot:764090-Hanusia_phi.AAC.4
MGPGGDAEARMRRGRTRRIERVEVLSSSSCSLRLSLPVTPDKVTPAMLSGGFLTRARGFEADALQQGGLA